FYPIPDDGPVGKLLTQMGRHPNRAAHIHFIITAPGYEPIITHIFTPDCEYLDQDAVFGVKESLVADFQFIDSPGKTAAPTLDVPHWRVDWHFKLV
ncbi:hypothetical protein LZF95_27300, partial [Algoriphagus sp. AGSA1]|nr:hypothetical protein [Algoriphagus sp. AGSA1]